MFIFVSHTLNAKPQSCILSHPGPQEMMVADGITRWGDYVFVILRFIPVDLLSIPVDASSLLSHASLLMAWGMGGWWEDGGIDATLICQTGHLCSVKRHSEVMFIIYDVLHSCIIYHRAHIGRAVLHWFVVLGQSLSALGLGPHVRSERVEGNFMKILVSANPNLLLVIFYNSSWPLSLSPRACRHMLSDMLLYLKLYFSKMHCYTTFIFQSHHILRWRSNCVMCI